MKIYIGVTMGLGLPSEDTSGRLSLVLSGCGMPHIPLANFSDHICRAPVTVENASHAL